MKQALRATFFSTLLSALFGLAGIFALLAYYVAHLSAVSSSLQSFGDDLLQIQDLEKIRNVCTIIVDAVTSSRQLHDTLVWWGFGMLVVSCVILGLTSAHAHILLRRLSLAQTAAEGPSDTEAKSWTVSMFHEAWAGKQKLWKAFWLIFLPGVLIVPAASFGLFAAAKRNDWISQGSMIDFLVAPLLISTVWLWYIGLVVLVWRCSNNTKYKILSPIVRIALLLSIAWPILKSVLLLTQLQ